MHPDTPAHIRSLDTALWLAEHAYNHAKEVHGIFSAPSNKALAALDAAQDAFDDAYNEFLRTTKLAAASATYSAEDAKADAEEARQRDAEFAKHLQADADGSAQTVAALRAELDAANARLAGIAEVLRKPICFPMSKDTAATLSEILYRNSL